MCADVHAKCPLILLDLCQEIKRKHAYSYHKSHEHAFGNSRICECRRTDGQEEIKEPKSVYFIFLSRTHSHSHSQCLLLSFAAHKGTECHVQRLTEQHVYCTNTVKSVHSATELYLQ
jgi:hypothetical protein